MTEDLSRHAGRGRLDDVTVAGGDRRAARMVEAVSEQAPEVLVDADGLILHATRAARHLLGDDDGLLARSSFFSLVHQKNLYRVIRDVAEMVCHGKPQAQWFLRLRNGHERWSWFQVYVHNELDGDAEALRVFLREV